MKYSSSNKPLYMPMSQSTWYKGTRTQTPVGILWHSTGANNPTLKRYCQPNDNASDRQYWLNLLGKNSYGNDWNHIEHQAGVNAWIGKLADGTVTTLQVGPWSYRAWGCGSGNKGSCNNGWIQFEICEDGLSDATYFNKVYNEAVELTAYLCQMYNIDPNGYATTGGVSCPTITCHIDSHKLGLGSNHGDVLHWLPKYGKSMATIRNDVAKLLGSSSNSSSGSSTTASTAVKKNDIVSIKSGAVYYNSSNAIPSWVIKKNWIVKEVSGTRAVIDKSADGANSINSPIDTKYLTVVKSTTTPTTPTTTKGKEYKIVTTVNRYGNAEDAKNKKNASGKYEAGTYYIYNKYPNGVNGMYNISKDSTGASAGSWINPAENVVQVVESKPTETVEKLYRVRLTKDDAKTQKGAYKELTNAKECADKYAADGYKVFDWNFNVVYTPTVKQPEPVKPVEPVTPTEPEKPAEPEKPVTPTEPEKPAEPEKPTVEEPVFDTQTTIVLSNIDASDKDKDGYVDAYELELVKAVKKIKSNNANFDENIAKAFFKVAPIYGINPTMAIAQSILETGWFKFAGSSVKPEQHNYCGLGATGGGVSGAAFDTIEDGVNAQCQHLFAYGCKNAVPAGITVIDPRFKYVTRGIAPYWEDLAGKWACPGFDSNYSSMVEAAKQGATYGQKILKLYNQIIATEITDEEFNNYMHPVVEPPVEEKPETPTVPPVEEKPDTPVDDKKDNDYVEIVIPSVDDIIDDVSEEVSKNFWKIFVEAIKKLLKAIFNVFNKQDEEK